MCSLRTLLRRVANDVTSSLFSWHKRYDFNDDVITNANPRNKRNKLEFNCNAQYG